MPKQRPSRGHLPPGWTHRAPLLSRPCHLALSLRTEISPTKITIFVGSHYCEEGTDQVLNQQKSVLYLYNSTPAFPSSLLPPPPSLLLGQPHWHLSPSSSSCRGSESPQKPLVALPPAPCLHHKTGWDTGTFHLMSKREKRALRFCKHEFNRNMSFLQMFICMTWSVNRPVSTEMFSQ